MIGSRAATRKNGSPVRGGSEAVPSPPSTQSWVCSRAGAVEQPVRPNKAICSPSAVPGVLQRKPTPDFIVKSHFTHNLYKKV
jgi:hypothetical protein